MYILDAIRTPIGRLYGSLSGIRPDDLVVKLLRTLCERQPWLAERVESVLLGCANQAGEDNRNIARMAVFLSGLPVGVTALTINSLCASGLDAVLDAARRIALGENDLIIAGGVESMSRSPWVESRVDGRREDSTIGWRFVHPQMAAHYAPNAMPQTAELLAAKLGISRLEQDEYAAQSRLRYQYGLENNVYYNEIQAVNNLHQDEQHRILGLTALQKLPPLVEKGQYITLGNSARIGDGAALVVLASEQLVRALGLRPMARLRAWGVAATHPDDMGLTPIYAGEKALKKAGIQAQDLDCVELSEAFAVQAIASIRGLGVSPERVNRYGGELSMGKPLGSSGVRLLVSLAHTLQRGEGRLGMAVTCAGLGVGSAVVVEGAY